MCCLKPLSFGPAVKPDAIFRLHDQSRLIATKFGDEVKSFVDFWHNESGATAVEYGLIAALVSIGIIKAATILGVRF